METKRKVLFGSIGAVLLIAVVFIGCYAAGWLGGRQSEEPPPDSLFTENDATEKDDEDAKELVEPNDSRDPERPAASQGDPDGREEDEDGKKTAGLGNKGTSPAPEGGKTTRGEGSSQPNGGNSGQPDEGNGSQPGGGNSSQPGEEGNDKPGGDDDELDEPGGSEPVEAYYLVWDDFRYVNANTVGTRMVSSWDISVPTSTITRKNTAGCFKDESIYSDAVMQRTFNVETRNLTWEFSIGAGGNMGGTVVEMRNGDAVAIRFRMDENEWKAVTPDGAFSICAVPADSGLVNLKVQIDMESRQYTVFADGRKIGEKFGFLNACDSLDRMYIQTTEEAVGEILVGTVRIYTGYHVNEKFLSGSSGHISEEWQMSGDIAAVYDAGTAGPDKYSAEIKDGASLSRDISCAEGAAWMEYQFIIPEHMDRLTAVLEDAEGNAFKIGTLEDQFGYYENEIFRPLYKFEKNLWYHVMLKQTESGTELYLNHKLRVEGMTLPTGAFVKLSFLAGNGSVYIDDILVKDWHELPDDYVPEPVPSNDDDYIVGLQSCSLWKEGSHYGWDWINDWPERKPYLGFYDEMSSETSDWEIKFKVEHGIDFELFCWYRPEQGQDAPIKSPRYSYALHEAFFNAEYSHMTKFAISWETSGSSYVSVGNAVSGPEDFRKNVVPYWIEQYFKDERYMLIDGKPVVGIYNYQELKQYFKTTAGIRAEMDYLRQACKDAGFEGCIILLCNSSTDAGTIAEIKECGFNATYAYSWGTNSKDINTQRNALTALRDENASIIPTLGMGRDDSPWERETGGFCTVDDFGRLLSWAKDEFMPTLPESSLGRKMVMLDNWNEFGEGHFLMPAELAGFGYLDQVRAQFGDDSAHEDVRPNQEQLERINHMYVQNRTVRKAYTKVSDVETPVVKGYYFEEEGNLEGWYARTDEWTEMENVRSEGGALKGTAANTDPGVHSPELNLDLNDVDRIRVRIKTSAAAKKIEIYFITETDTNYDQNKFKYVTYSEVADGYTEIVIDMNSVAAWKGTLKEIRLDMMTSKGDFEIDSIEFLGKARNGDVQVVQDDNEIFTVRPVICQDDTVMFPAAELETLTLSGTWSERIDDEALEMYINGKYFFSMPYGENRMTVNGEEQTLTKGACVIEGEAYFPLEEVMKAAGYTVVQEGDVVNVSLSDSLLELVDGVYGWYFEKDGDTEGWEAGNRYVGELSVADGALKGTSLGNDPYLKSPAVYVDLEEVDQIRVKIRTTADLKKMEIYFTTTTDTTYDQNKFKTVTYSETGDGYTEVVIDMSSVVSWKGILKEIRLDMMTSPGVFEIDSIELAGKQEEPAEEIVVKGYYFDMAEEIEGWTFNKYVSSKKVENGALKGTVTMVDGGTDPFLRINSGLDLDLSEVSKIRLKLKTATENKKIEVYFTTKTDTVMDQKKYKAVTYEEAADGYTEVVIDMSGLASWTGILNQLRIDMMQSPGEFEIDSIEILK